MESAARWLLRAQVSTLDDGFSHSFDVLRGTWLPSYPETTGYVIETLYEYAVLTGQAQYAEAARRAADWEISIQLPEGGVMAGTLDARPVVPTVFNTGQVIFGWLSAASYEPLSESYREAARRAADWLVAVMDADGAWRRFPSPYGTKGESAFNTRTAFGLACAGEALGDSRYLDAAVRQINYVVAQAADNGFLPNTCLQDSSRPLTHTIAYSIRGLLEVGAMSGRVEFVDLALRMARAVARVQRLDGGIPGRLDEHWQGRTRWVCLTGNSQMALNWLRFAKLGISMEFMDHAVAANRYVMALQDQTHSEPGIRGGIKGSHPIGAEYMSYRYPNWAAKFFLDALMLELELRTSAPSKSKHVSGPPRQRSGSASSE